MKNFSPLASKLREEFEVTATHTQADNNFYPAGPFFACLNSKMNHVLPAWYQRLVAGIEPLTVQSPRFSSQLSIMVKLRHSCIQTIHSTQSTHLLYVFF